VERRALAIALVLSVLLPAGTASGDAAPACVVESAGFRFHGAVSTRTRLRLQVDLPASVALAEADPRTAPLRLSIGGFTLVDLPETGTVPRVRSQGRAWRLRVPVASGGPGRVTWRMDSATGRFTVQARGFDPGPLLSGGTSAVPVSVTAGGETWETTIDFDDGLPGLWIGRPVVPPPPPPPGGGGPPSPPPDGGNSQTIAKGSSSGIHAYRFEAIYDGAAWQALWLQHAGAGPAPAVDFSTEMVIGVWLGDRPTSGYRAEVLSLVVAQIIGAPGVGPGYLVTLRESQPGYNCITSPVVTQPFHIVRAARTTGGVMAEMVTLADGCF
jgi:hypothetical protein